MAGLEILIARFFSVSLFLIGLSHLIQPRFWRDYFIKIKETGAEGIIIAMYTLPQGLLIVLGFRKMPRACPVESSRCPLHARLKIALGCHGLVPWRLTLSATRPPKNHAWMPRACPV